MSSNRIGRINDEIQKELSALLRTVKDPRVTDCMLTITHVDTTIDLRYARIYVSALNCPDEKGLLKGLKSAAGYLRHELGSRIDLRYTPELQFFVDDSIVRGTTCRRTIDLLRKAGAKEIHMRVSAPPLCPNVTTVRILTTKTSSSPTTTRLRRSLKSSAWTLSAISASATW